jgi:hypothetical protein
MSSPRVVHAPRGTELTCKNWLSEAAYRMIQNNLDPNTSRLFVLDIDEEHIQNDIVTNVNLVWDPQTTVSFDTEGDLQSLADELPATVQGLTVSAVDIIIPTSGVPYGEIQSEISGLNRAGALVTLYQKMAVFKLKARTLMVTFTTEGGFTATTLPMFDGMLETLIIVTE